MKNVLFIAGLGERYYYDPFIEACRGKGICIYVFDPSRFPSEERISVALDEGGHIVGFVDVFRLDTGEPESFRLPISDIDVAWYVRGSAVSSTATCSSLEDRFVENESRTAVRSLLSTLECSWVNRKETVDFLASNKLYQQLIAQQCGLIAPRTLISNDPESVTIFSDDHDGLLLKSIGYVRLDDKGRYFLYSQRFSHKELIKRSIAIRACPIFSQEYIKKHCEHRVMVIGNRVLSCRIDSQASEATKVDWRHYDFEHVAHVQSHLPANIQQKLLRFMEKIGLRYGAIDLIETPEEDFVFLEVNPTGQWGWIADFAKLPIPEAVADMLESLFERKKV